MPSARRRLLRRAINVGEAGLFGLLAYSAGSVAAGGAGVSDADQRSMTTTILSLPGGRFLVGTIGIGIVVVAGYLVYRGFSKAFLREMDMSSADPSTAQLATRLGQVGWTALGIAYGTAGVLVVFAALNFDPREATGLDRGLKILAAQPHGVAMLLVVAAGVACFGVYTCLFDARYRRSSTAHDRVLPRTHLRAVRCPLPAAVQMRAARSARGRVLSPYSPANHAPKSRSSGLPRNLLVLQRSF